MTIGRFSMLGAMAMAEVSFADLGAEIGVRVGVIEAELIWGGQLTQGEVGRLRRAFRRRSIVMLAIPIIGEIAIFLWPLALLNNAIQVRRVRRGK